jgi:hypothetical protein
VQIKGFSAILTTFVVYQIRANALRLSKMKKKRLDIDYSYDFELVGVISSIKGYKLAWEINNQLGVNLIREDNLQITFKNRSINTFSYFSFQVEGYILKLFRNKPNEGEASRNLLAPEYPHFDFILLTQSDDPGKLNRLQEVLRAIPSVELVAFIPLATLKLKDHFIF